MIGYAKRPEWSVSLKRSNLNEIEGWMPVPNLLGTLKREEIAAEVAERCFKRTPDIMALMDVIENVINDALTEGYAVQTSTGILTPSVTGLWDFDRIQPANRVKNKAVINFTMSKEMKERFANPLFHTGMSHRVSYPQISICRDHYTQSVNDLLTPGHVAFLEGRLMRFLPENPEHGVFLEDVATKERVVFIQAKKLPKASGQEIMVQLPPDLKPGSYRIGLVNQCTNSGRPTKQLRTARLEAVLRVAEKVDI